MPRFAGNALRNEAKFTVSQKPQNSTANAWRIVIDQRRRSAPVLGRSNARTLDAPYHSNIYWTHWLAAPEDGRTPTPHGGLDSAQWVFVLIRFPLSRFHR